MESFQGPRRLVRLTEALLDASGLVASGIVIAIELIKRLGSEEALGRLRKRQADEGRPTKAFAEAEALGIEVAVPTIVAEPRETVGAAGDADDESVSKAVLRSTAVRMVKNGRGGLIVGVL
jgi:hypothetical protein